MNRLPSPSLDTRWSYTRRASHPSGFWIQAKFISSLCAFQSLRTTITASCFQSRSALEKLGPLRIKWRSLKVHASRRSPHNVMDVDYPRLQWSMAGGRSIQNILDDEREGHEEEVSV